MSGSCWLGLSRTAKSSVGGRSFAAGGFPWSTSLACSRPAMKHRRFEKIPVARARGHPGLPGGGSPARRPQALGSVSQQCGIMRPLPDSCLSARTADVLRTAGDDTIWAGNWPVDPWVMQPLLPATATRGLPSSPMIRPADWLTPRSVGPTNSPLTRLPAAASAAGSTHCSKRTRPLGQQHGERFDLAPFSVVLDPLRAAHILGIGTGGRLAEHERERFLWLPSVLGGSLFR